MYPGTNMKVIGVPGLSDAAVDTGSVPSAVRNRIIATYAVAATGGSADAIVVSHTHTVTDSGHSHTTGTTGNSYLGDVSGGGGRTHPSGSSANVTSTSTTGISINTSGSSGTNANLPPYYALAYIMKS